MTNEHPLANEGNYPLRKLNYFLEDDAAASHKCNRKYPHAVKRKDYKDGLQPETLADG
jgi:hypothetical protein